MATICKDCKGVLKLVDRTMPDSEGASVEVRYCEKCDRSVKIARIP